MSLFQQYSYPGNYSYLWGRPTIEVGLAVRVNGRVVFFRPIQRNLFNYLAPDLRVGANETEFVVEEGVPPDQSVIASAPLPEAQPTAQLQNGEVMPAQREAPQEPQPSVAPARPRVEEVSYPVDFRVCHKNQGCIAGDCEMQLRNCQFRMTPYPS